LQVLGGIFDVTINTRATEAVSERRYEKRVSAAPRRDAPNVAVERSNIRHPAPKPSTSRMAEHLFALIEDIWD
jgi:hypothetical protein